MDKEETEKSQLQKLLLLLTQVKLKKLALWDHRLLTCT